MNRIRILAVLGGWAICLGNIQAGEIWTETSYFAKDFTSTTAFPVVRPDWEIYSETKVESDSSVMRIEQSLGKNRPAVIWVAGGRAAMPQPDGSVVVLRKDNFDEPEKPSVSWTRDLKPVATVTAAGKKIQVFDKPDSGGRPTRAWVEEETQSLLAQVVGKFITIYTEQSGSPAQLELPPAVRESIKEFKRGRQKGAISGNSPP